MILKRAETIMGDTVFFAYGEDSEFICHFCGKEIKDGFKCENKEPLLILCVDCQKGKEATKEEKEKGIKDIEPFNMRRCKHEYGEHQHIRFTRGSKEEEKGMIETLKMIMGFFI